MGRDVDAKLFYGYCLEQYEYDMPDDWEEFYANACGVTEQPDEMNYYRRIRTSINDGGVEISWYGADSDRVWFVAVTPAMIHCDWGAPAEIDPTNLVASPTDHENLAKFCKIMGITPGEHTTTPEPRWWLVARLS